VIDRDTQGVRLINIPCGRIALMPHISARLSMRLEVFRRTVSCVRRDYQDLMSARCRLTFVYAKIDPLVACYHVFRGYRFPAVSATAHRRPTSLDHRLTRWRPLNKFLALLVGHGWGQIRDSPQGTSRSFKVFPGTKRGQ